MFVHLAKLFLKKLNKSHFVNFIKKTFNEFVEGNLNYGSERNRRLKKKITSEILNSFSVDCVEKVFKRLNKSIGRKFVLICFIKCEFGITEAMV